MISTTPFLKTLLYITTILIGISLALPYFLPPIMCSTALPILPLILFATTYLVHVIMVKGMQKRASLFVNIFMVTTFVKLFFYIFIIGIYGIVNPNDVIKFALTFFVFYIIYSIVEIKHIVAASDKLKTN